MIVSLNEIRQARSNLAGVINKTPLQYTKTFSDISDNEIYLKPENLQKTGSFKIRGAYNKIANLSEEEKNNGVVAFSAGNHGAGTAYAAQQAGIKATVIMPENPVPSKKNAITQLYCAEAIEYGTDSIAMFNKALQIKEEEGRAMIHPFDDPFTIAGQGTIGLEVLEELPEADAIIVPVSGGGLISGIAAAVKEIKPTIKVIGVNTEGATAMYTSRKMGVPTEVEVNTIADGLMAKKPGDLTFAHTQKYVDDLVLVSEEEIANSVAFLAERAKLVVEPSGAAAISAVLHHHTSLSDKKVIVMVSGGNISFELFQDLIQKYNEKIYAGV
ncbi:threonine/serine dehydratase [Pseudalkalibacillus sp. A8]|uniref:threonine ammonia-lyase n=1 Tax=Pseudalkalibacillus sp. A8 TaxID=3382641 RepID=UPI0038B62F5E